MKNGVYWRRKRRFVCYNFAKCEYCDGSTPISYTIPQFIYQQDGAPPHFRHDVRRYLNDTLPHRQIGHASEDDSPLLPWPPRSHDLTPCEFFIWGYVKYHVLVPVMPSIYQSCDKRLSMQSLELTIRCWYVYGRSYIIGSMSAESPTVGIWNTCKVRTETLRDSLSSGTNLSSISAMVTDLQTHETPEGLLTCSVCVCVYIQGCHTSGFSRTCPLLQGSVRADFFEFGEMSGFLDK